MKNLDEFMRHDVTCQGDMRLPFFLKFEEKNHSEKNRYKVWENSNSLLGAMSAVKAIHAIKLSRLEEKEKKIKERKTEIKKKKNFVRISYTAPLTSEKRKKL